MAPDRSPAKAKLQRAKVQRGCGHSMSPALAPGGQRQSRSVEASKGLNVGIGGKLQSLRTPLASMVGIKPVAFIGTS